MKLVMNERAKHRLIGLAVILSIGAIFAPAIVKKSNQRFDSEMSASVTLPPKPLPPKVAMPKEKEMFETVRVAHVELPAIPEKRPTPAIARAESLSQMNAIKPSALAESIKVVPPVKVAKSKIVVVPTTKKTSTPAPVIIKKKPQQALKKPIKIQNHPKPVARSQAQTLKKEGYGVQLATFSQQHNADSLITKLRAKGYKANYNKVMTPSGVVYKVVVGHTNQRSQAQILKQQLASAMQLQGFIVPTRVS